MTENSAAGSVSALALSVVGIYSTFLTWGYMQERVTAVDYELAATGELRRFDCVSVLNLTMALAATVVARFGLSLCPPAEHCTAPSSAFLQCAISNTLASPFGYASLAHITYPMLMLAKASKLIPIMAMGKILGFLDGVPRRYRLNQYAAAALLTIGIAMFSWSPEKMEREGSRPRSTVLFGLGLVLCNLLLDGFTNARQERIFRDNRHRVMPMHLMCYMNAWSTALLAGWLVVGCAAGQAKSAGLLPAEALSSSLLAHALRVEPGPDGELRGGELLEALRFFREAPQILPHIAAFAAMGAVGQIFIFLTISRFGPLVTTTICLTRKCFSILISVVAFGHALTQTQWAGCAVVFAGLALQSFGDRLPGCGKPRVGKTKRA
jgi:UDP-galactose transporter B1